MATGKFAKAVTPHATTEITPTPDYLQVGTGGTVACRSEGSDTDVSFTVPDGGYILCRITHVRVSGTSASNIVGISY